MIPTTIENLSSALSCYPYRQGMIKTKHHASVAIILREQGDTLEVLMIRRAHRKGDPWSGHMAFPGGKYQPCDDTFQDTAIREVYEEIGLHLAPAEALGTLSQLITRHHDQRSLMRVIPWVFHLKDNKDKPLLKLNHEATESVWIPMKRLTQPYRQTFLWPIKKLKPIKTHLTLPCYRFEDRMIWGLSLTMLDELEYVIQHQGKKRYPISTRLLSWFK